VKPGQTLFGKRRAYQRKVAYAEFDAICSGDIYTFEADETQLLGEFLPFLVQSNAFFDRALGTSAGSLSPRTNWRDLTNFEFHLPTLDEQKRFADLLWAIEVHRHSAKSLARSARTAVVELIRQQLGHESVHQRVDQLGEVQLGQRRTPKSVSGPMMKRYLRVANVGENELLLDDVLEMDFSASGEKLRLRPGDILLNEGQSIELVGRAAMFNGEIDDCYYQSSLLRFRSGPQVLPHFALAWFRYCLWSGRFAEVAARTTTMAHLPANRFAAMGMPCPPRPNQERLVRAVHACDETVRVALSELAAVDVLHSALLSEIFGDN
jgi:type I restriction enzyme S subunit